MKLLCYLVVLFTFGEGFAMKPAPMTDDVNTSSAGGGKFKLFSSHDQKKTTVSDSKGKVVWEMNQYIAKMVPYLSPDGEVLVLVGDDFVGFNVSTGAYLESGDNPTYFRIYVRGEIKNKIQHKDLFAKSVAELTKEHNLREKGGGWVSFGELIPNYQEFSSAINWKENTITLQLLGGKEKAVRLY